MQRRKLGTLLAVVVLLTLAGRAGATLSPQAYEMLRAKAPIAFGGVVLQDQGGRIDVRVEHVERGMLTVGSVVPVTYPEDRGSLPPPGPAVYYRRFQSGDRLKIWGSAGPTIVIVPGGIDLLYRAPPPAKRGGCAACAVYGASRPVPKLAGLGGCLALLGLCWRRRTRTARPGAC